jgi:GNAT superfamily N-acetyltransferase
MEYRKANYSISTDINEDDLGVIYEFLTNCYWAHGIPYSLVRKSVQNSLCFGVHEGDKLVGFARVVSDYATFAYLADVFVLESHRGKGLSKWLMECIMSHPELQGLRRWVLSTRDAHELYRKYGFSNVKWPERYMEILNLETYGSQ